MSGKTTTLETSVKKTTLKEVISDLLRMTTMKISLDLQKSTKSLQNLIDIQ